MSDYVVCVNCGDHIHAGERAVHFSEGWYCKDCGIEALWDEHGERVYKSDCKQDANDRGEGPSEEDGLDDAFEAERNRRYGIDV